MSTQGASVSHKLKAMPEQNADRPKAARTAPIPQSSAARAPFVFRTDGLTKLYGGKGTAVVRALDGVDLDLPHGEIVVLLGPSGSGKSTLLNILGGLDHATSGKAWFQDHEITAMTDRQLTLYRRDHVGFVFQFYNLVPSLTARENVALVTDVAHDPMPVAEALALVGLKDRLDHFPAQMSGGEQQRVAIARAIAKRPAVLLCDEPTGALDSKTGLSVLNALKQVNDAFGTAVLVITHNANIQRMAHRVIRFQDGKVVDVALNETRLPPEDIEW
ncbi:ABC transporter ATP-binding protein [Tropicibacter oceani]|uniref:ABC transporter ATP-binding protein n=1 Tax=Tropicibacter oceani TaxID=3058420 RepID=A0ABY8QFE5_9RHOB|nr:ABC transporter ATP-binding protein [Tropicibacter oceani]WGW03322.1 ABC transporter ATP-binding protein [Tropicibacter oceani]